MPDLQNALGVRYLEQTRFTREGLAAMARPQIEGAPVFKRYEGAPLTELPRSLDFHGGNLWQALSHRRSERRYDRSQQIDPSTLALLCWAMQGVTAQKGPYYLRTSPSAGALYPLETYVAVERVKGIEPGVYHLDVRAFGLSQIRPGSAGADVAAACLDQAFMTGAAVNVIWTSVHRRNMVKYGHRGMRYVLLDAGHACQNLLLAATALELAACPVAAFFDEELNDLLGVDGEEESAVYAASVGVKAPTQT